MEKKILSLAINKINQLEGINGKVIAQKVKYKNKEIDARILLQIGKEKKEFNVEIKRKVVPAQISDLKYQIKTLKPIIIIAEYITTKAKEIFRAENIPYLDTLGNIFIREKDTYIFIETNTTNRKSLTISNRAFNKTGLKVIYQLLIHPEYINEPYRFLGEKSMVAIDTVSKVYKDLLKAKLILKTNTKKFQFTDRKKLFHEWVNSYNKNLKPKLKQKKYIWLNEGTNWKKQSLPSNTLWGGEIAAEILTNHLIGKKLLIYTSEPFSEIMKSLKLVPNLNGNIVMVETFWKKDNQQGSTVNPLLVYADLIESNNPRLLEVTEKIYKEHVEGQL